MELLEAKGVDAAAAAAVYFGDGDGDVVVAVVEEDVPGVSVVGEDAERDVEECA